MADQSNQNSLTFSLQTPADLYRKIRFEGFVLFNNPPVDLTHYAYGVTNAVTSAWQMKDWVYCALGDTGKLHLLDTLAHRKINDAGDFGQFLAENNPWLNACFRLATAAKHFEVRTKSAPEVFTTIEFKIDPNDLALKMAESKEIIIRTANNSIPGADLVLLLVYIWGKILVKLGLLQAAEIN
jgi:hypothetical protein